jgi:hydrogenase expression/formation protein HypD
VRPEGNPAAQAMLEDVFEVTDRAWRGIGVIPDSGWRLSERYREFDAEHRFSVTGIRTLEPTACRAGEVLQGLIKPHECEAFGTTCTPRNPLGATMVSSEGACAAYYLYRRLDVAPARQEASPVG